MTDSAEQPRLSVWRRILWPDWPERKRLLRIEGWTIVAGAWLLLAFSGLFPQDFESTSAPYVFFAWMAFLVSAFRFHIGLLLAVVALGAAVARLRRMLLATAPVLLYTLVPVCSDYVPRAAPGESGPTVRVMSVNLLVSNTDTAGVLAEIRSARPDILLLQEYSAAWHQALNPALSPEYPHSVFKTGEDSFGGAVYSRFSFVGRPESDVQMGTEAVPQFRAVVDLSGRHVAVYNIHLLPAWKFEYALEGRLEFADLLALLREETLPVILGGDFNFTGTTPQARGLRRAGFRDAWDLAGCGHGATWPASGPLRFLPGFRIDHVYLGPGVTCVRCVRGEARGSDHRPLVADVRVDGGPAR